MVHKSSLVFISFLIGACSGPKSRIKIYKIDYARQSLVRSLSDKDVLTFSEADGFLCTSPKDLERLAEEVIARENHCKSKE